MPNREIPSFDIASSEQLPTPEEQEWQQNFEDEGEEETEEEERNQDSGENEEIDFDTNDFPHLSQYKSKRSFSQGLKNIPSKRARKQRSN